MKLIFFAILFMILPASIQAHVGGQPTLKINGIYVLSPLFAGEENPDIAPQSYTVGQNLLFEVDIAKFITPQDIFEKTDFIWDFGDESLTQTIRYGKQISYAYKQPGTYLVTITADYAPAGFGMIEPQILDAVSVNILAVPESSVPKPVEKLQTKPDNIEDPNIADTVVEEKSKTDYFWIILVLGIIIAIFGPGLFLVKKNK